MPEVFWTPGLKAGAGRTAGSKTSLDVAPLGGGRVGEGREDLGGKLWDREMHLEGVWVETKDPE